MVDDNLVEKRVVGHIPKLFSKTIAMFLSFSRTGITCEITRKRVNREAGFDLEIRFAFTNSVVIRKILPGLRRKC